LEGKKSPQLSLFSVIQCFNNFHLMRATDVKYPLVSTIHLTSFRLSALTKSGIYPIAGTFFLCSINFLVFPPIFSQDAGEYSKPNCSGILIGS